VDEAKRIGLREESFALRDLLALYGRLLGN